jgi:formate hydrogenlyase transcriptional activator
MAKATLPFPRSAVQKYETLLKIAGAIALHRDLGGLLRELAEYLHKVVKSDCVALALHDEKHGVTHWHTLQAPQGVEGQLGVESPVDESPSGWVWQHQETLLLPDSARS